MRESIATSTLVWSPIGKDLLYDHIVGMHNNFVKTAVSTDEKHILKTYWQVQILKPLVYVPC